MQRQAVDAALALRQHAGYERALEQLGLTVRSLPPDEATPDSVFTEDIAIVVGDKAIITRPATESRRAETESIEQTVREVVAVAGAIAAPATLEGGDVLSVDSMVYVGQSTRTNAQGAAQLTRILEPLGYSVTPVSVRGCLHLKTGCTYLGNGILIANPDWIDTLPFVGFEVLPVDVIEPFGANTLTVAGTVLVPASAPRTQARIAARGFTTVSVDISELEKVEAGLSCCSVICP
jgi:dimethylargininase